MAIAIDESLAKEIEARCIKDYEDRGISGIARIPLQVVYHIVDAPSDPQKILGGLSGFTFGSYLAIELLLVSEELRGNHIGQGMLARAELEARKRGCTASIVNTFDFGAEGFYVKQGYTPYARLSGGFNNRATRIYLFKQLLPDTGYVASLDIAEPSAQFTVHDNLDIDTLLNQGLEEHASAKFSTPIEYNYQPLALRITSSTDCGDTMFGSGLVGHSGGSFMMIEGVHVETRDGPPEKLKDFCVLLLQKAETIARDERLCTRVILHAFDFEIALLAASATLGYELTYDQAGWFGGGIVRHFLSKAL